MPATCTHCGWPLRALGSTHGAEGTRVMSAEVFVCKSRRPVGKGKRRRLRPCDGYGRQVVILLDAKGNELTGIDFADPTKVQR